ncbi:MAG: hypothetical protein E3J90_04315 [Promethearchaeota archaeon]|nr:MAG: hypothetical protein E3J90_04315 [Candidatus Lokiarchaeota archaeon]
MSMLEKQFLLFKIEEENEDFVEIEVEDGPIHMLLDKFFIFIIVDPEEKKIWIWHGENASIRKKFIAAQKAPEIRDNYGVDFKITAIDEGSEPSEFKKLVGL